MAEVIPASGDDWREIERRASLLEGHVERALLEILQRLVPVENQVMPVGSAGADHVPTAGKMVTPAPAAAPAGGVTEVELAEVMYGCKRLREVGSERVFATARHLFNHPRIGPLLRGWKRVALAQQPPMPEHLTNDPFGAIRLMGYRDGWAAARAEVARQQGEAV